jgi:hypothetical protein
VGLGDSLRVAVIPDKVQSSYLQKKHTCQGNFQETPQRRRIF